MDEASCDLTRFLRDRVKELSLRVWKKNIPCLTCHRDI